MHSTHIIETRGARWKLAAAAAIAAAALTPAAADAATKTYNGTVVAKDAKRQTVVTTDARGAVRTFRVKSGANSYRIGQKVAVRGTDRADGTYDAGRVKRSGKAGKARVRAAIVQNKNGRYLVSAGGSTFSIRAKARVAAAPGDIVVADVTLGSGGPAAETIREVGQAGAVELEGIFLGLADGKIELAVERRGRVFVTVPPELTVDATPGDEIELIASVQADGSFVLLTLDGDDEGDDEDGDDNRPDHGIDLDMEDGEAEVDGVITALSAESITVQAGSPTASITCAVPAGVSLEGFAVQDEVEMKCELVNGSFELRELESENAEVKHEVEQDDDDRVQDDDRRGGQRGGDDDRGSATGR
jgi:hypothetical protein